MKSSEDPFPRETIITDEKYFLKIFNISRPYRTLKKKFIQDSLLNWENSESVALEPANPHYSQAHMDGSSNLNETPRKRGFPSTYLPVKGCGISLEVQGTSIAFPMAQWVKNLPALQETQETWVQSLGWEDPTEKEMATYSRILAWKIPWTEEPGRLQPKRSQGVKHD